LLVMRKQQQAPDELELVRGFVNTLDVEEATDALSTPPALGAWLRDAGLAPAKLEPTAAELRRAVALREALREILVTHSDGSPEPAAAWHKLDEAARRARLRVRFDQGGSAIVQPEAEGVDAAVGRLLAIVQRAIAEGTWRRLKACRLHTCEWVFYDHTKNRSGAWCNMEVCGNRAKARAYRERHAGSAA
jgi:predicted RNA-binding Zn ribbon-like protein